MIKFVSVFDKKKGKDTVTTVDEKRFNDAAVEKKKVLRVNLERAQSTQHVQPLLTLALDNCDMIGEG